MFSHASADVLGKLTRRSWGVRGKIWAELETFSCERNAQKDVPCGEVNTRSNSHNVKTVDVWQASPVTKWAVYLPLTQTNWSKWSPWSDGRSHLSLSVIKCKEQRYQRLLACLGQITSRHDHDVFWNRFALNHGPLVSRIHKKLDLFTNVYCALCYWFLRFVTE